MRSKPTLYLLCGLPGSGKSTWSQHKLKENPHIVVHSSDTLREELLGDVNEQSKNADIFIELHRRIKRDLIDGKDVIMDCTNLSRKKRMAFLRELTKIKCYKVCVFFATPFEVCIERNRSRNRVVPDHVMWRMYKSINIPCKNEGFDAAVVINSYIGYYGDAKTKIQSLIHFSQDNPHHTLSLGEHCLKAYEYVCNKTVNQYIRRAALLHDVGKIKTKVWENNKREPTAEAHYFGHEFVSAYDSLFYTYNDNCEIMMNYEYLYIALLIELHMKPYYTYKESKKSLERDKLLLGEEGWINLMNLNIADNQSK